ncbi:hypothetical protein N481_03880 [Pseudoalteromonas luteoviolacea S4047-1]|uniref:Uncharacterized protein n=1 Tax=Pseudoalteromonas luteoviolacea S4054 TaxID=1129367 RepID=A0A0F6A862_9GAMM|nr:hypothetical protein N479_01870 [Pseudoalteromonas luteoviolacea S4054]KZN77976.1 hypothetical protein N481_03880 [Pseudoalteromonas luteoviolacea S4047-1]
MLTLKTKKLKQLSNSEVLDRLQTKQIGGAQFNMPLPSTNTIVGTRPSDNTNG